MGFGSLSQFRVLDETACTVLGVRDQVLEVCEPTNTWSKDRPGKPKESLIRQNVAQDEPRFSSIKCKRFASEQLVCSSLANPTD
jgi:hypothetical protein